MQLIRASLAALHAQLRAPKEPELHQTLPRVAASADLDVRDGAVLGQLKNAAPPAPAPAPPRKELGQRGSKLEHFKSGLFGFTCDLFCTFCTLRHPTYKNQTGC
jgi:hypothetical protein